MKGESSRMIAKTGFVVITRIISLLALAISPAVALGADESKDQEDMTKALTNILKSVISSQDAPKQAEKKAEFSGDVGITEVSPPDEESDKSSTEADIQVSPQGKVEMHVRRLDLASVLQVLSIESKRNIIASSDVGGTVTANLYSVTFDEALNAILASNNCAWRERGNFIYVYTLKELAEMESAKRKTVSRLFRLHYARAADVLTMIEPLKSDAGIISVTPQAQTGIAVSGEGGTETGGDVLSIGDCLLVVDYPEHIEAIGKVIAEIDVRPKMVLVEATILRARLSEENALGINFNLLGGTDFEALSTGSLGATNLTKGAVPLAQLHNTTFAVDTDFTSAVPAGGFTFGLIKNSVAVFIRALERITDTTVLANPKILALNKQSGEVFIGREEGYLGGQVVTQVSNDRPIEKLKTGTRLVFRPFIGDNGYVRMEVHPEDSSGEVIDGLPLKQTTEVTTNILVRDGNTILIGGLFREVSTENKEQLPFIGNIPVLGALGRNTLDTTLREEVIILLTVHIVNDDQAFADAGKETMENIERYRVGMRQGLQWFGRERLAQAHYRWALDHLAKGHISRAMWDLDLAINNNPKFLAAIKLKEDIQNKRGWDEDSSDVRGFLYRRIMEDTGSAEPLFGRPGPPFEFPALRGPSGFDDGDDAKQQVSSAPDAQSNALLSGSEVEGDFR